MAEESNLPGQNEGSGEIKSKHPEPVNLAVIEAEKRGIDLAPPATELAPADDLAALAQAATKGRLSPGEEERATANMRSCIEQGGEGIHAAFAAMGRLPWILGVRAIEQAWPSLSAEARAAILARLAEERVGDFIRLRLSLARSLTKLDPPIGVQLAASVCRTMWIAGDGMLTPADSKLIGNVFIGRGKPWVLQLSLDGLGDEDADAIVSCVTFSAFNVNNPPITQLSVLRYGAARLGRLHANLLGLIAKGVSRWNAKWQGSLQSELGELPEQIAVVLKQSREAAPQKPAERRNADPSPAGDEEAEVPLPPELEEKLKLAMETGDHDTIEAVTEEVNAWRDAHRISAGVAAAQAEEEGQSSRGRRGRRGREKGKEREQERERPAYVSREQEAAAKSGGPFNLTAALRGIENHFQQLRNELGAMQARLRKAETAPRRPVAASSGGESNLSPEELKRLVLQLERRNADLQARVEELLADSEARALATASDADITGQYRTLLKLKLQEDYADYLSLESSEPDVIVQQHYRALTRHVFSTLRAEGIALEGDLPPPPPEPMPPPPPPPDVDDEEEDDEELDRIEEQSAEENSNAEALGDENGDDLPGNDDVPGEGATAEAGPGSADASEEEKRE